MIKEDALPNPASMLERELSEETLMAIKAIVREDRATVSEEDTELDIPGRQRRIESKRKETAKRKSTVRRRAAVKSEPQPRSQSQGLWHRLHTSLKSRAPTVKAVLSLATPRRIAVAVIVSAILIEPWFLPTVLFLTLLVVSFIALALGPDRVRHYSELGWKRYATRHPEKARQLQKKAMYRMERLQKRLDKLPSRWTQGLHLPQMQSEAEQSAAETAYSRRMAQMAREERQQSYS